MIKQTNSRWIMLFAIPIFGVIIGSWILATPDPSPDTTLDLFIAPLGLVVLLSSLFSGFVSWSSWLKIKTILSSKARYAICNQDWDTANNIIDKLNAVGATSEARLLTELAFLSGMAKRYKDGSKYG